jgi:hypothetical protein
MIRTAPFSRLFCVQAQNPFGLKGRGDRLHQAVLIDRTFCVAYI